MNVTYNRNFFNRRQQSRSASGNGMSAEQLPVSCNSPGLGVNEVGEDLQQDDVEVFSKPPHKGYGSLDKIYPHRTTKDFDCLCVLNRAASIFLGCLGFRETLRMNTTAFRTFVRFVIVVLSAW